MKFGIDYFPDAHPDQVSARQYFEDVLDLAGYADELGYDSVKIVEHYFTSYGGYSPDPCLFLAACSQRAPHAHGHGGGPARVQPPPQAGRAADHARRHQRRPPGRWRRACLSPLRVRRLRHLHGGEPRAIRGGDRGADPAVDGGERHLRRQVPPIQERDLAAAADAAAAPTHLDRGGGEP